MDTKYTDYQSVKERVRVEAADPAKTKLIRMLIIIGIILLVVGGGATAFIVSRRKK